MDHLGYIAAALCALSLLSTALQLSWLLRRAAAPPSAAHERKFHNFKVFRTCLLGCVAGSQLALAVAKLVEQRGALDAVALGNAAVAACWIVALVGGRGAGATAPRAACAPSWPRARAPRHRAAIALGLVTCPATRLTRRGRLQEGDWRAPAHRMRSPPRPRPRPPPRPSAPRRRSCC
jgi:hypothetical protein